jgi:protoporphyrinogen oxidase
LATVVVVGGGLAGLACGWRLARQGHAVRVLERADAVGGRARSLRRGPYRLDTGCPVVVPAQRRILALAREAGLLASLRPLVFGRDMHWSEAGLVPLSRRDWLDWSRLARVKRPALRAALDLQRPARVFDPATAAAGNALSAERARRAAAADVLAWWPVAPHPWEEPLSASLRSSLGLAAPHAFAGAAGGMGALGEALARPLDVVTGCEVSRVETDSDGAYLDYRVGGGERRERADAAVVALPATRVAALCPKLTPEERGFFELARSEPGIVVHLLFHRAPRVEWRSVVLGRESGLEVAGLLAEHARPGAAPHGAGVLRAVLAPRAASRMFRAGDASIADLVLENLAYSPVGTLRPDDFAVWRHADLAPRFDADHCRRLARFATRLERSPRLAFAGDFLAGPSADAAVASGLHAAREVAHVLGTGSRH